MKYVLADIKNGKICGLYGGRSGIICPNFEILVIETEVNE